MTVDLIVFRLPDLNSCMQFVALDYVNGVLAKRGEPFTVIRENDNYRTMRFDHIVLALKVAGGSLDLNRFAINDCSEKLPADSNIPAVIYKMRYDDLCLVVDYIVKKYHQSLQ